MKKTIPLAILLLSFTGLSQAATADYLQSRNGVAYQVNQETPFSGDFEQKFDNGQKAIKITFKDGKKNGTATEWYYNGEKRSEESYNNGVANGLMTQWYYNGQKSEQITLKNGEENGTVSEWYNNGQKRLVANYTAGKHSDGIMTGWYENGNSCNQTVESRIPPTQA